MKPKIGISMGDPAGIGPEIIIKTLALKDVYERCSPLVVGDAVTMQNEVNALKSSLKINAIQSVAEAKFENGIIDVFDLKNVDADATGSCNRYGWKGSFRGSY